jgi:flagellar hook-length control protein FliK
MSGEGEVKNSENAGLKSAFAEEVTLAQGEGKAQKIENMQSIIKQARAVLDDGGGSMEVHLQPEGLGKVHLKVAVNDGQVNVEMMTDNQLAKKALEEGILDIKQALEGQKLLVETVKVEMSPDYQKDFSDLQDHMQEQANRDFAEQFLGQFQREREERLGGMFDAFRNFRPGADEPDLNMGRNPYTENGKGRSINLVA